MDQVVVAEVVLESPLVVQGTLGYMVQVDGCDSVVVEQDGTS